MLSVNGKILRDVSRVDTTSLRRPKLNVKEVFNRLFLGGKEVLNGVICGEARRGHVRTVSKKMKGKMLLIEG